jgi:hypothetical protein
MPYNRQQESVQTMYKPTSERDVLTTIQRQKETKMPHWKVAESFGPAITAADISRILHGVFPKGEAKREALGLPPVCPTCWRKYPKPPRVVPDWLEQAVANLVALEANAGPKPPLRVYGRGGKLAQIGD